MPTIRLRGIEGLNQKFLLISKAQISWGIPLRMVGRLNLSCQRTFCRLCARKDNVRRSASGVAIPYGGFIVSVSFST